MPDTCVPTSTSVTGSTVPVAVTTFVIDERETLAVSSETLPPPFLPVSRKQPATTTIAAAVHTMIFFFLSISISMLFDYLLFNKPRSRSCGAIQKRVE